MQQISFTGTPEKNSLMFFKSERNSLRFFKRKGKSFLILFCSNKILIQNDLI